MKNKSHRKNFVNTLLGIKRRGSKLPSVLRGYFRSPTLLSCVSKGFCPMGLYNAYLSFMVQFYRRPSASGSKRNQTARTIFPNEIHSSPMDCYIVGNTKFGQNFLWALHSHFRFVKRNLNKLEKDYRVPVGNLAKYQDDKDFLKEVCKSFYAIKPDKPIKGSIWFRLRNKAYYRKRQLEGKRFFLTIPYGFGPDLD